MRITTDSVLTQRFNEWEREQERFEELQNDFDAFIEMNDQLDDDEIEALEAEFLSDPEAFFGGW